jgi:subtilisin family serine protease
LSGQCQLSKPEFAKRLKNVIEDRSKGQPVNWRNVEEMVRLDLSKAIEPEVAHGTHVAGIIGADWQTRNAVTGNFEPKLQGVCPDIGLYDFRVLGSSLGDSEFAVSAALQFIRYFNEQLGFQRIHGVNMSLAIRHNVRNYACGKTPVCKQAEALVANGVVVVAAAGNRGYIQYQLADQSVYEGYASSSITDPGNADGVITVGATHRSWPHTFGVSFFSSRGPTGDGRLKPDLLAPGEKINSCVPGGREDAMDGTSMAAPHVSGAAALLMARHDELKGNPQRIKKILCDTATDLNRERHFQGHGMVDVLRAIQSI